MSHKAIRTLIEDTVRSVDDSILFAYARASDFNAIGIKEDKRVRLDPLKQVFEFSDNSYNLNKTYKVGMVFYQLDSMEGAEEETKVILDQMDLLSDKFIAKLNNFAFNEDTTKAIISQNIEIKPGSKDEAIKVTVDCCTGWILQFDIVAPDTFDYCSIYDS